MGKAERALRKRARAAVKARIEGGVSRKVRQPSRPTKTWSTLIAELASDALERVEAHDYVDGILLSVGRTEQKFLGGYSYRKKETAAWFLFSERRVIDANRLDEWSYKCEVCDSYMLLSTGEIALVAIHGERLDTREKDRFSIQPARGPHPSDYAVLCNLQELSLGQLQKIVDSLEQLLKPRREPRRRWPR